MKTSQVLAALVLAAVAVAVLTAWPGESQRTLAAEEPAPGKKLALLVGCTRYPNVPEGKVPTLTGPANDVQIWHDLLTDKGLPARRFGFAPADITQLVGWPDDEKRRPTYQNIRDGFEKLVQAAEKDSQVVIVLCGHGSQMRIPDEQTDPLDPANPEPDGMDEIFLPADLTYEGPNAWRVIKDDDIGRWLDRLRDKGAHVWIVFDACHSGTMNRGDDKDSVEVARTVEPHALGIDREKLEAAARRGREAVEKAKAAGAVPTPELQERVGKKPGSVVAFYAAQPFERAPEMPLPPNAVDARIHGVLSYTLLSVLAQRQSPMSYRELTQLVAARYRATRNTRPPTPSSDGDLARQVLGMNVWPERASILLEKVDDELRITAGTLRGLTPGAVLDVRPPAGDPRDYKTILGHVKVTTANPTAATVAPTAFAGKEAVPAEKLALQGRCEVVFRDLGDLRVKLAFDPGAMPIAQAVGLLPERVAGQFTVVKEADAQWVLRRVTPAQAQRDWGLKDVQQDVILLTVGDGRQLDPALEKPAEALRAAQGRSPAARRVYARYSPADPKALAGELTRDLPKLFAWQNLWRVATEAAGASKDAENYDLLFETARLKGRNDTSGGELLRDPVVAEGQVLEYRLENKGVEDLWVTMLYLGADLEIRKRFSGKLQAGVGKIRPIRVQVSVENGAYGPEGYVVLASPLAASEQEPNYDFLEQEALGGQARSGNAQQAPKTPFGLLLQSVTNGGMATRGERTLSPTDPAVLSSCRVTIPKP